MLDNVRQGGARLADRPTGGEINGITVGMMGNIEPCVWVAVQGKRAHDFVRGHCGLSGKEDVIGLCNRHRGYSVNPSSGRALVLLTLSGSRFPSGNRLLRPVITVKEKLL